MSLPVDLTTITVTASYADLSGAPQEGYVAFSYPGGIIKDATGRVIFSRPVTAQVIAGVMQPVTLPCNDSAHIVPQGFQLNVIEHIGASSNTYQISLPSTLGATVDLSALAPAAPVPAVSSFATPNTWTGPQTLAGNPPMIVPGGAAGDLLTLDGSGNVTPQVPHFLPLPSGTPAAGQVPVATGTGQGSAWGYPATLTDNIGGQWLMAVSVTGVLTGLPLLQDEQNNLILDQSGAVMI